MTNAIDITIKGYKLAGDSTKTYGIYDLEIYYKNRAYYVEKRYSQFHALHKEIRKFHHQTPPFPPKKVRSVLPKLLEQRREQLEKYLQIICKAEDCQSCILKFLGIDESRTLNKRISNLDHPPVFELKKDCYLDTYTNINDIIKDGTLLSIYRN